jgi:hypothetical protein
MPPKLSKSDYEKALGAEWGHPVFLNDKEYERLSTSKPSPERPAKPYADPFGHLDADKARKAKPDAWATKAGATYRTENPRATVPGVTYNNTHGRGPVDLRYSGFEGEKPKSPGMSASNPLAGVPAPKSTAASKIERIEMHGAPKVAPSWGPALTAETSMPVGVEYLNGVNPDPYVEDLGGDDRPNTLEEKMADEHRAALLAVPDAIATLPQTYKKGYAPPSAPVLPQWQSDEDEWEAMNRRYAMLSGGK